MDSIAEKAFAMQTKERLVRVNITKGALSRSWETVSYEILTSSYKDSDSFIHARAEEFSQSAEDLAKINTFENLRPFPAWMLRMTEDVFLIKIMF